MSERLYPLVRVAAGDYLLLSNDAQTLWRISRYLEDESAEYRDAAGRWRKISGYWWETSRRVKGVPAEGEPITDELLDWDEWRESAAGFRTRAAAVEHVLEWGAAHSGACQPGPA